MKIRPRTSAALGSAIALFLVAGNAAAQDQFRFGESSVGRSREDGARASQRTSQPRANQSRSQPRDAAPLRSASSNDRARVGPSSNSRATSRNGLDRAGSNNRATSRADFGPRSAIDPDGDGRGLSYADRTIWDRDVLARTDSLNGRSSDRDRNDRDFRDGSNWGSHDRDDDRYDRKYDKYDHNRRGWRGDRWDDDCDDWSGSHLAISIGSSWSDCDDSYYYGSSYGYGRCATLACGGCSTCLPYSYRSSHSGWIDPWASPVQPVVYVDQPVYVDEPVVVTPPVVVAPAPVVITQPLIVYASSDVSDAILAADAGAHARAVSLMRAYAAQQGRLPDLSELGPAARTALVSVRRTYERASLASGATADTYFMLGACRALMGENDLALMALDAAASRGDTDPSCTLLRDSLSR